MKTSKKIKNIKLGKIFTFAFGLVTFGLMLTMADFFSSLITVGGFSFSNDNINQNEYKLYAVYTNSYQEKILASECCEQIQRQGGAGYIYMNESSYTVIAGMYENETDAKKVLSNIIEKKPDANIMTITIPQITINSNLTQQEKATINASITLFKNVYKKLYDISISLDTAVVNEVKARLEVNEICSNTQKVLNDFNTIFSENIKTNLLSIRLSLESIITYLNDLINSNTIIPFSSLVKECYCKIIFLYKNTAENL